MGIRFMQPKALVIRVYSHSGFLSRIILDSQASTIIFTSISIQLTSYYCVEERQLKSRHPYCKRVSMPGIINHLPNLQIIAALQPHLRLQDALLTCSSYLVASIQDQIVETFLPFQFNKIGSCICQNLIKKGLYPTILSLPELYLGYFIVGWDQTRQRLTIFREWRNNFIQPGSKVNYFISFQSFLTHLTRALQCKLLFQIIVSLLQIFLHNV